MLPSTFVSAANFQPAEWSLGAVFAWGASDFLGGYATRRANAFLFAAIVNIGGLMAMLVLAAATHAAVPSRHAAVWAIAAGASGGASLAAFYRALSSGRMGLTAPIAAVLSAAIPTVFAIFSEGFPGKIRIAGFFLATAGLWLITRSQDSAGLQGIKLAIFAGLGFAGFYLCAKQAGQASPIWIASFSRMGGLLVTGIVVLVQRRFHEITPVGIAWAMLAGCVDSLGTIFYVCAAQTGRLDEAVVISSLYPAITVLLAWLVLKEHFSRWRFVGLLAALAAVPMIAAG
jgi:drug/metabolite transporter (DMT)-like permease